MELKECTCARCGAAFNCQSELAQGCWCNALSIPESLQRYLHFRYSGCLCPDCLSFLSSNWGALERELTSLIPQGPSPMEKGYTRAFRQLVEMVQRLRKDCPWDGKQTLESLRTYTVEEVHELVDAIGTGRPQEIAEELGDLLMHVIFYAAIAQGDGLFDLEYIIGRQLEKLVYRHPHVFGPNPTRDPQEVERQWERLKQRERGTVSPLRKVMAGVPRSLPALEKAVRIQEKAHAVGFDWENPADVWPKVKEEIAEFEQEVREGNRARMEEELGDLLSALVNMGRLYGCDPVEALTGANARFIARFNRMEDIAAGEGRAIHTYSLQEQESLWQQAKKELSSEDEA